MAVPDNFKCNSLNSVGTVDALSLKTIITGSSISTLCYHIDLKFKKFDKIIIIPSAEEILSEYSILVFKDCL